MRLETGTGQEIFSARAFSGEVSLDERMGALESFTEGILGAWRVRKSGGRKFEKEKS